jgi:integrase
MECVRLRVKDIDFDRNQVTVRDGKGMKDRATMLPGQLKPFLQNHLEKVKINHERGLEKGFGEVYLAYALEKKYKKAAWAFKARWICCRKAAVK